MAIGNGTAQAAAQQAQQQAAQAAAVAQMTGQHGLTQLQVSLIVDLFCDDLFSKRLFFTFSTFLEHLNKCKRFA